MKVTLKKDVLTPHNGVGRTGQTVEMNSVQGAEYVKAGLAEEAADDAEALPADAPIEPAKPLTNDTLKENAEAESRKKKPATGPAETK